MPKFQILATVVLVMAVLALAVVPLVAEGTLSMICLCTVYEDGIAVGPGHTVTAYMASTGDAARASGLTDAEGKCTLFISVSNPQLDAHEVITFKVDGLTTPTDPDPITATLAPTYIRLGAEVGEEPTPTPTPTLTPAPTPKPACFIATAAYGTSIAPEIDTLRAFRDEVLLESTLGSQLVDWYYQTSPPVADFISDHEGLRTLVRDFLVDPVAWVVEATETLWRD